MHINWTTLALQTINVLVLVWLLGRFLYRPVMAAIAARQAAADALLADAEAARHAASAREAAAASAERACAADAERRRAAAEADMAADRARSIAQARRDVALLHEQAATAVAEERRRWGAALEAQATVLAGRMAARLLDRLPPALTTEAMFRALLDRVATMTGDERRRIVAATPLLVTPAPLGEAERARYAAALAAVLPGLPDPDFTAEPAMIAGCELRGGGTVVENSWRADLDGLLAALQQEDAHGRIG